MVVVSVQEAFAVLDTRATLGLEDHPTLGLGKAAEVIYFLLHSLTVGRHDERLFTGSLRSSRAE